MKLNRHQLFVIGVILIMLCTAWYRIAFLRKAEITNGLCVAWDIIYYENNGVKKTDKVIPKIAYRVDGESFEISGVENQLFEKGSQVPVIYNKENYSEAFIYDFTGFWLYPVITAILLSLAWLVFSYGAFEKGNRLVIRRFKTTSKAVQKK
jgi:hypothetical protein